VSDDTAKLSTLVRKNAAALQNFQHALPLLVVHLSPPQLVHCIFTANDGQSHTSLTVQSVLVLRQLRHSIATAYHRAWPQARTRLVLASSAQRGNARHHERMDGILTAHPLVLKHIRDKTPCRRRPVHDPITDGTSFTLELTQRPQGLEKTGVALTDKSSRCIAHCVSCSTRGNSNARCSGGRCISRTALRICRWGDSRVGSHYRSVQHRTHQPATPCNRLHRIRGKGTLKRGINLFSALCQCSRIRRNNREAAGRR
jgi:hypothetical protein